MLARLHYRTAHPFSGSPVAVASYLLPTATNENLNTLAPWAQSFGLALSQGAPPSDAIEYGGRAIARSFSLAFLEAAHLRTKRSIRHQAWRADYCHPTQYRGWADDLENGHPSAEFTTPIGKNPSSRGTCSGIKAVAPPPPWPPMSASACQPRSGSRCRSPRLRTLPPRRGPLPRHSQRRLSSASWRGVVVRRLQILTLLNLSALPMTETELRLIAAAANIGERSQPKNG